MGTAPIVKVSSSFENINFEGKYFKAKETKVFVKLWKCKF